MPASFVPEIVPPGACALKAKFLEDLYHETPQTLKPPNADILRGDLLGGSGAFTL